MRTKPSKFEAFFFNVDFIKVDPNAVFKCNYSFEKKKKKTLNDVKSKCLWVKGYGMFFNITTLLSFK